MVRSRVLPALLAATVGVSVAPAASAAQSIEENLALLAEDNAELYIRPLTNGLGSALTAGLVNDASPHRRFGFTVGIRGSAAFLPDEGDLFPVVLPGEVTVDVPGFGSRTYTDPYTAAGDGLTPSVSGDGQGVLLTPAGQFRQDLEAVGEDPNDWTVRFPEGADLPVAPFAVLDGSLGLGFGTDVIVRLVPTVEVHEDVGDVSAWGIGVMHSLTQYLPVPTPLVDVSLTAGLQRVELADYAEMGGRSLGLVAGAGLGPLRVYARGGLYDAEMDVRYTIDNPGGDPALPADGTVIAFESDVERTSRLGLGVALDLLVLKLSGEYAWGDYDTASLRVALGLR